MKRVVLNFYYEFSEEVISVLMDYISSAGFGFIPDKIVIDDDYNFIDGINYLKQLDKEDFKKINLIINEKSQSSDSKVFLTIKKWTSKFLLNFSIRIFSDSDDV